MSPTFARPDRLLRRRTGLAMFAGITLVAARLIAPAASSASTTPPPVAHHLARASDGTSYDSPELQARTNLPVNDNGWNLPPGAQFNSITPGLNDEGTLGFRVQLVPVSGQSGA